MLRKSFPNFNIIINEHEQVIRDIRNKKDLRNYFIMNNLMIFASCLIFGLVLGTYVGGYQIFINSLKVPMLFLFTLYISLPVFYIVDLLMGSKITFAQIAALLVTGFTIASIIMIAFTPVLLFFILTAKEYVFIAFLSIGIVGFSGYFGIFYIIKNFKLFHDESKKWLPSVLTGSFIIGLVGTQLSWTLRPFFHSYDGFIRPAQGNFYVEVAGGASRHPYIAWPLLLFFMFIAFLITMIIYVKKQELTPQEQASTSNSPPNPPSTPPPEPYYPYQPQPYQSSFQHTEENKLSPE